MSFEAFTITITTLQFYGQELQDRALVKFVYEVLKTSTEINLFKIYKWHLSR